MSTTDEVREIVPRPAYSLLGATPADALPAGPDEGGVKVGDVLRVIKQRKLLILVTFVALYLLVGVTTLVIWKWAPAYPAEAFLQLRPPQQEMLGAGLVDQMVDPKQMNLLLTTEARKLKRLDVLRGVLELDEIKATSFFQWYDSFDDALFDLEDLLRVAPVPDTELISVNLAIRDRTEAVKIVKTLLERYTDQYKQETRDTSRKVIEDLKATRTNLTSQLLEKQTQLGRWRQNNDVGALESESETLVQTIRDQKYLMYTYDTRASDLQAQLDAVSGVDPRQLPITPEDRVIVESDPLLRLYRQQVESLDVQIEALTAHKMGPAHRQMKHLMTTRDGYYRQELTRREELHDDLRERRVDSLRQELARVRAVQARTQEQIEEAEARQAGLDSARVTYENMVKEEERLQTNLGMVEQQMIEIEHAAERAPREPRLSVVQWPVLPNWPSRPDLLIYLGGGFILALAGAFGLAFLREALDKRVRTPVDVARHGRLSVLGCIPELSDEEADVEEIEFAVRQAPHSLIAESFRQIRANLVFSGPAERQRTLLITSPGPGNGKTAVAINLATVLAQAGERVLLIDCNFRRPAIRQRFADTRPEGLSNILIGRGTLADLVTHTDLPNLDVLSSGPMPPNPADLLSSTAMHQVLDDAQQSYDRVILDGPPVLLVSDALVLATQTGSVILVARAVENTKGGLRRAGDQLAHVNAHVIGAVLNGVQARPGGYYRQQYREFYEYGSDETIPKELPGLPELEVGNLDNGKGE